jgi:hypothetical protein
MGHEEQLPPRRLSDRRRFSQGNFAKSEANARDAPDPVTGQMLVNRLLTTLPGREQPVRAIPEERPFPGDLAP